MQELSMVPVFSGLFLVFKILDQSIQLQSFLECFNLPIRAQMEGAIYISISSILDTMIFDMIP